MHESFTQIRVAPPQSLPETETSQEQLTENEIFRRKIQTELRDFTERYGVAHIIGILGGSEAVGEGNTIEMMHHLMENLAGNGAAILTGGSSGGVPEIAHAVAKEYDIPTIGVYPPNAIEYGLSRFMDLGIMTQPPSVGTPSFTSETYSLVNCLNAGVVVGGSYGTLVEVGTILKRNKSKIGKGQKPIYLCPIAGSGGVADYIRIILGDDASTATCLPSEDIDDGIKAAHFLKNMLNQN